MSMCVIGPGHSFHEFPPGMGPGSRASVRLWRSFASFVLVRVFVQALRTETYRMGATKLLAALILAACRGEEGGPELRVVVGWLHAAATAVSVVAALASVVSEGAVALGAADRAA